jgi:hypothetical protein
MSIAWQSHTQPHDCAKGNRMSANRVRKGATYRLECVLIDHALSVFNGKLVRVIELPGCLRSRMPRCLAHVETIGDCQVLGMVHTNSLRRDR